MSDSETVRAIQKGAQTQTVGGETKTLWHTSSYARGPFGTMFGGLIAGVMADSIDSASTERYSHLASIHVDFIRPVQPGEIEAISIRTRRARTMAWFSVTLRQNNKDCAVANIIKTVPSHLPELPISQWSLRNYKPSSLRSADRSRPLGGAWFGDLLDYRIDESLKQNWFSLTDPAQLDLSTVGFAATIADYAAGVSRPDSWEVPAIKAFPNPMMSVVFHRAPEPGWVGLNARSVWNEIGIGLAVTDLLDMHGVFGASQQINALIPFE